MLMDRVAPDDREKAKPLLREALASYTRIGMLSHVESPGPPRLSCKAGRSFAIASP